MALRVYVGAGRFRDLRLRTVAASKLPGRSTMIFGDFAPTRIQMEPFAGELRRRIETEMERSRSLQRAPRATAGAVRRITI